MPTESLVSNQIEPIPWRGVRAPEKLLLIVLPLCAAAILALKFLDEAMLRRLSRLPGAGSILGRLAHGNNPYFVFIGISILLIALALLIRRRLNGNKHLWFGTGCPECLERDLVRVKREPGDRFYRLIGVPAYRYACRNCTWRGLRIARRDHSPAREWERDQALLRFQPDGLPHQTEIDQTPATGPDLSFIFKGDGSEASRDGHGNGTEQPDLTSNGGAEVSGLDSTHRFTIIKVIDKPHRPHRPSARY